MLSFDTERNQEFPYEEQLPDLGIWNNYRYLVAMSPTQYFAKRISISCIQMILTCKGIQFNYNFEDKLFFDSLAGDDIMKINPMYREFDDDDTVNSFSQVANEILSNMNPEDLETDDVHEDLRKNSDAIPLVK